MKKVLRMLINVHVVVNVSKKYKKKLAVIFNVISLVFYFCKLRFLSKFLFITSNELPVVPYDPLSLQYNWMEKPFQHHLIEHP